MKNERDSSREQDTKQILSEICTGIRERLNLVLGSESNNSVARRTHSHAETIRRYRKSGQMKASFVAMLALEYKVNADWLLTGRGKPTIEQTGKSSDGALDVQLSSSAKGQHAGSRTKPSFTNRLEHLIESKHKARKLRHDRT